MLSDAPIAPTLPVVDLERAIGFYEDMLGLELMEEATEMNATFECGKGTSLVLYKRDEPTKADSTAASFYVEDLEEVVEELKEKGVVFEQYDMPHLKTDEDGIAAMGEFKGAWFKDTEGNIIGITNMM
ncbi:VOC family protein [Patescibacteria group bacterium]|nr:VOC family protein [Patescibacteria group bacterium]